MGDLKARRHFSSLWWRAVAGNVHAGKEHTAAGTERGQKEISWEILAPPKEHVHYIQNTMVGR